MRDIGRYVGRYVGREGMRMYDGSEGESEERGRAELSSNYRTQLLTYRFLELFLVFPFGSCK